MNPVPARIAAWSPRETQSFSAAERLHLIEEVAALQVPRWSLSGGDPLLRSDCCHRSVCVQSFNVEFVDIASYPTVNPDAFAERKACGLMHVGFWLHGSTPGLNDHHWGASGLHRRTVEMIGACQEVQLPVHVNTIVAHRNIHDVEPMIEFLTRLDVEWWNVRFFVPTSAEQRSEMLTADEPEEIFAKLYDAWRRVQFHINTTEASHHQRYILEQRGRESRGRLTCTEIANNAPRGVNDGKGFVSSTSRVRFIQPVSAGFRRQRDETIAV